MTSLVIRYSSMGDIVLGAAVTEALAPVIFLTLERYAVLAAALPGVVEVRTHEQFGKKAFAGVDQIIDLHRSPRSRWATLGATVPVRRIERFDLRRRARVALKWDPAPPVIDRYAAAAGVQPAPLPWLPAADGDALLLFPAAAHPTKRWPIDRFVALARRWTGPVVAMGGPDDHALLQQLNSGVESGVEIIAEDGFQQTLKAMRRGRVAVGGDTGLTHLAAASGVHTIPIFGPTHSTDGFWSHPTQPIEVDLECRPCSRHGGAQCPIGDFACMTHISVDRVWAAVQAAP